MKIHAALLSLTVLVAGCPAKEGEGRGPLAGDYLARSRGLKTSIKRLATGLEEADKQLESGSPHAGIDPLRPDDLVVLRKAERFPPQLQKQLDDLEALSQQIESALDELGRLPPNKSPQPVDIDRVRGLVARGLKEARRLEKELAAFIDRWS